MADRGFDTGSAHGGLSGGSAHGGLGADYSGHGTGRGADTRGSFGDSGALGLEASLLSGGSSLMRRGYSALLKNCGKLIAALTALIVLLVTFTEVGFYEIGATELTANVILLLVASYVIYFSLEDAGERLGRETEEYREARRRHEAVAARVDSEMMPALRGYVEEYRAGELAGRRAAILMGAGLCEADLAEDGDRGSASKTRAYANGIYASATGHNAGAAGHNADAAGHNAGAAGHSAVTSGDREYGKDDPQSNGSQRSNESPRGKCGAGRRSRAARAAIRRAMAQRPIDVSAGILLSGGSRRGRELHNPERTKFPALLLRLIPTTICTLFTASVMLSVKDGLGASEIIEGLVRLCPLPVVALRGYSAGYLYASEEECEWMRAKTRLLESFLRTQGISVKE